MNESEDQKLTDRIRDVFENFEDNGADMGWQELRKSYPESKSRPLLWWMSSVAALLILATGLWFWNRSDEPPMLSSGKLEQNPTTSEKSSSESASKTANTPADTALNLATEPAENSGISPENSRQSDRPGSTIPGKQPVNSDEVLLADKIPGKKVKTLKDVNVVNPVEPVNPVNSAKSVKPVNSVTANTVNTPEITEKGSLTEEPPLLIADAKPAESVRTVTRPVPDTVTVRPVETEILAAAPSYRDTSVYKTASKSIVRVNAGPERGKTDIVPVDLIDKKSDNKLSWAIVGGSFFNFAEGSESALNFSAGLGSDIRLSRKLKLSTGISLAKNSLYYDQGVPTSRNLDYFSAPNPGQISSGYINTASDYTAELINLDIPLNLKYTTGRNGFFISGGLSSGTYLSEKYSVGYRAFNLTSNTYSMVSSTEKVNKSFAEFDLANTLNFSFGMSLPFGKNQNLSIEPFLKYPLQGLGSQDLRFGASGLHLRLNFNNKK